MSNWREQIIREFVPGLARVTAASDTDGLLRDPGVIQAIQDLGFSVLQFDDSIAFRYDYESRFRSRWDAGEHSELIVVFSANEQGFETLPADVLGNARRVTFTLMGIFPKLSYSVVSQLESTYFDVLYQAQMDYGSQALGDALTRDFVLQHVFGIVPSVIKTVPDLLRVLCHRHYRQLNVPRMMDDHLIARLGQNSVFDDWPLEAIVPNRSAFWEFLNERWPIFLERHDGKANIEGKRQRAFKYSGPEFLPFDHDDIRIYVDHLFRDGTLTPARVNSSLVLTGWLRVGVQGDKRASAALRFEELRKDLLTECPVGDSTPQQWLMYATRYSQAIMLWAQMDVDDRARLEAMFREYREETNSSFFEWAKDHYGTLFNYPPSSPLMVNHIQGFINHRLSTNLCDRAAFILIDGLAIDQWLILKESLKAQGFAGAIEDNALFAWIPTLTPISRQAAFSGKIPRYFAETFTRTDKDESRWRQFWIDRGYSSEQLAFWAVPGNNSDLQQLNSIVLPAVRALGITLFKIDKIMHGMQLGAVGMAGQVKAWSEEGFPLRLFDMLLKLGFELFISSDHGNIEATGIGRPKEGVLSDNRGERCRIYSDPILSRQCLEDFPEAISWESVGLPEGISTLLAPYGKAFGQKGAKLLCHGGAALEEVCVPFVRISKSLS
jgi:hypothetical protein